MKNIRYYFIKATRKSMIKSQFCYATFKINGDKMDECRIQKTFLQIKGSAKMIICMLLNLKSRGLSTVWDATAVNMKFVK